MDYALRENHLRPSSRRSSPSRQRDYQDINGYTGAGYNTKWQAPVSGRSTPSAAVRRALQVLDESYKKQDENKRWNRNDRLPPYRRGRSRSPSKSRTPSPVRKFLRDARDSPIPRDPVTPPRILEIERDNLQDALGDSESRRNVLLRKLAETQRTMEIQNDALRKGEMELRESKTAGRLLQQVQEELETKVQYLEKERNSHLNRQLHDAEEKEALRREADNFHHEMKRLQCQVDLMETDKEERLREMNRIRDEIRNVQDSNRRLLEDKSSMSDELAQLKESLSVAKQRIELTDKEKNRAMQDLMNVQDSQQAIINRNTELGSRLSIAEDNCSKLRNKVDESEIALQTTNRELETYKEKSSKLSYKLAELQTNHKEIHADLERSNRYINELERTLQTVKEMNQKLKETKIHLEDNLTALHSDLAKTRLECSKKSDENSRLKEELESSRKVQKDLSSSLDDSRQKLSTTEDELNQLQIAKKSADQKITLMESRKKQADTELEELTNRFVALQQTHEELKFRSEDEARRSDHETRELRIERDRLEGRFKESETRLERLNLELTATIEHDQTQLDHWRETCGKLTSLLEEKDRDQRDTVSRLRMAEEAAEKAEAELKSMEKELASLQEVQHEAGEMEKENKRLAQEIKENQQMISVLEMERDVLSKSPSKSSESDGIGAEVKKLQTDLKMALEKLTSTETTKQKSDEDEMHRKGLETLEADLKRAQENNRLLDERLNQVKKEAETLHGLMEARTDTHEREVRKMERERERLESRIRSLEDEARLLRSSLTSTAKSPRPFGDAPKEFSNLRFEVSNLRRELEDKEQSSLVVKGQLVVAQNARRAAEDRIAALESQLASPRRISAPSSPMYRNPTDDSSFLRSELEAKRARLDAVEAECAILRSRNSELMEAKLKLENNLKIVRRQMKELKESTKKGGEESIKSDESERSVLMELSALKRDLQRAHEDISSRDEQLSELRKNLVSSQRQEQKARQQRDELKGKTIIMESMTDSSGELRKELENLRREKLDLEKQLNAYIKSKTSQTPRSNFTADSEKDLEKQYKIVCERNKWLEKRISSLSREIELLRDQNSLLNEEKRAAERQTEELEGELKSVTMSSKSNRQQNELENIHLQNSNAEKMQQVLELQRDLREKNQLIEAMTNQIDSMQKKNDKKKISSFMKKLKRSTDSTAPASPERGPMAATSKEPLLSTGGSAAMFVPSPFSTQTLGDGGYSTMTPFGQGKEKHSGRKDRSRPNSADISLFKPFPMDGDFEDVRPRSRSYQQLNDELPPFPENLKGLSPSPTYPTSGRRSEPRTVPVLQSYPDYISDTGQPIGSPMRQSPETVQPLPEPPRKRKGSSSRHETTEESSVSDDSRNEESIHARRSLADASGPFTRVDGSRKRSQSSDRHLGSSDGKTQASSTDETEGKLHESGATANTSPKKQSKPPVEPVPEIALPKPAPAPLLPSPTSSPSVLSPTSARNRQIQIHVTDAEELIDIAGSPSKSRPK